MAAPQMIAVDADIGRLVEEEGAGLHARARRERTSHMLSDYSSLLYASLATGQSLETVRVKLLRLLDTDRPDSAPDEQREFETVMSCGVSADKTLPHTPSQ